MALRRLRLDDNALAPADDQAADLRQAESADLDEIARSLALSDCGSASESGERYSNSSRYEFLPFNRHILATVPRIPMTLLNVSSDPYS